MIDCDMATWGLLASFVILGVTGGSLGCILYGAWESYRKRSFGEVVWFSRCVVIYMLFTLMFMDGFDVFAKVVFWYLVVHMVILNPWTCQRETQKEVKE